MSRELIGGVAHTVEKALTEAEASVTAGVFKEEPNNWWVALEARFGKAPERGEVVEQIKQKLSLKTSGATEVEPGVLKFMTPKVGLVMVTCFPVLMPELVMVIIAVGK